MGGNRVLGFLLALSAVVACSRIAVAGAKTKCLGHTVLASGIPCEMKNNILKIHNEYRQQISNGRGLVEGWLKASNMRQMYWDEELARKAQHLTDSCIYMFDHYHKNYDDRFEVAQSIGYAHTNALNENRPDLGYPERIESWMHLHKYKPARLEFSPRINAETYLIGCGYTRFKISRSKARSLYVCNYGPSPVRGKEAYQLGEPASECPAPLVNSTVYSGLCSLPEPPNQQCDDANVTNFSAEEVKNGVKSKIQNGRDSTDDRSITDSSEIVTTFNAIGLNVDDDEGGADGTNVVPDSSEKSSENVVIEKTPDEDSSTEDCTSNCTIHPHRNVEPDPTDDLDSALEPHQANNNSDSDSNPDSLVNPRPTPNLDDGYYPPTTESSRSTFDPNNPDDYDSTRNPDDISNPNPTYNSYPTETPYPGSSLSYDPGNVSYTTRSPYPTWYPYPLYNPNSTINSSPIKSPVSIINLNPTNNPLSNPKLNRIFKVGAEQGIRQILDKTLQQLKTNATKINNVITINIFE